MKLESTIECDVTLRGIMWCRLMRLVVLLFFFKVFKFSGFVFFQFAGQKFNKSSVISVQSSGYCTVLCTTFVYTYIDPCKNYQKEQGSPYVQNKYFLYYKFDSTRA